MKLLVSSFSYSHLSNPRKAACFLKIPMSWSCKKCTFLNPPSQKSSCQICLSSTSPSSPPLPPSSSSSSSPPKWSCKACTFLNPFKNSECEVCGTRCSVLSLSNFEDLNNTLFDGDLDSSVGSVFLPLRPCKRKIMDPIQIDDDCEEPGRIREVKASSKAINDTEDLGKAFSSLKILSYNVWFREDLEVYKRMKAIGDLIQQHSPDLICFQEVTPNIFDIFKQSSWWNVYRCSVSNDKAHSRPYFCMVLSKLPVKSFSCKPFSNSIMGRELCISEIEAVNGKSFVVATSHLESPCPAPPKWDQMYSKERVEQAHEALNLLKKYPNVVFGGDMNWDDKLDGQFPLQDGWIDAWSQLRPKEVGWTYDTKSNQMLSGNRTLQKRLDRFVCGFQDFKISSIDMIGTNEIPGVSYNKEKKVRKETKQLVLPVLPSDHYGLLLTVSSK
ncbi:tyrosyl-DNA phosphodiesterase 2 [Senna tora]|uniref:Tyrosyl-DNA phosphodiesterase 2 n=1 Tax=Senna tora TaxID=362788 RepID=A0A834SWM9_9FABA|nr:tyrosyl-DNA phosphodiesterase 2 [Senna tora]